MPPEPYLTDNWGWYLMIGTPLVILAAHYLTKLKPHD